MDVTEATRIGRVSQCRRYPTKSLQGLEVDRLDVDSSSVRGDRVHGLVDQATGRLLAAKRNPVLLQATADDTAITLPDGAVVPYDDPEADARLSAWLGRDVRLVRSADAGPLAYEMTFDPPNEDAEVFDIPVPDGTLLDLSPVHAVTSQTLDACAAAHPELDWDVRRFRPNLVLDVDVEPFGEQAWIDGEVAIGEVVCKVTMPMLRCAMPLRAQPGLERQPELFRAMSELNEAFPNHLGICLDVVVPGTVSTGDDVLVGA